MIGKLFLICAPSGTGKTTLVNAVLYNLINNYNIRKEVTYTSRIPRAGETHGEHYYFISELEFEKKIRENFFIEWSNAYGTYYGSSRSIMEDLNLGQSIILIVDNNGVKNIIREYPLAIIIRITPPNFEELINRLNKRSTENINEVQKRLELARIELEDLDIYKLCKYTITNKELKKAKNELEKLIINEISRS